MAAILSHVRCRKCHLLLVVICFLCLMLTYEIVYLGRRYSEKKEATVTKFPLYFTDYSPYKNYSGPHHIPGPITDPDGIATIIDEPDFCSRRNPEVKIIYYVHSAPWHSAHRDLIRQAWGSDKFFNHFRMVTVFFIGRTPLDRVQKSIQKESDEYHDIIQMDFDDNYYNLTYKSITALNWIHKHCPWTEFVLKTDDDVFINIFLFVRHLRQIRSATEDFIYCHVYAKMDPHRNPKSKWFITPEEYPWAHYPEFCAGMVVYYSAHLIPKLLNATRQVPFLKLDDVYLTGLLRNKSNIKLQDISKAINIFEGRLCQTRDIPELFCHISAIQRRWEIWISLLCSEMTRLSKANKNLQKVYAASIYDIINKDLVGFV